MNKKRSTVIFLSAILIILSLEIFTPINLIGRVIGLNANQPNHPASQIDFSSGLNMNDRIIIDPATSTPDAALIKFGDGSGWKLHITKKDGTKLVTFQDSGNVGIGTNSPAEKLTVSGNILASGSVTGTSITGNSICIGSDCRTSWPVVNNYWGKTGVGTVYSTSNVRIGSAADTTYKLLVDGGTKISGGLIVDSGSSISGVSIADGKVQASISGGNDNLAGQYTIAGTKIGGQTVYAYGSMCVGNSQGDCSGSGGTIITGSSVTSPKFIGKADSAGSVPWSGVTGKPTIISSCTVGYNNCVWDGVGCYWTKADSSSSTDNLNMEGGTCSCPGNKVVKGVTQDWADSGWDVWVHLYCCDTTISCS